MTAANFQRGETECGHSDVHWHIHHQAFSDSNMHYLEISGRCKICETLMIFRGVPIGMTPAHPTRSVGGDEIRLPFLGAGEEPKGNLVGYAFTEAGPA
ncbi:MAG: hypothetical protein V4457_06110 [Pseudomonadota bacterium]